MKTFDSTSTISTIGSQILEMDFKYGHKPCRPEEEYVEEIISSRHKRSSEMLIFGDSVRKCREDNERILYIQEHIMNDMNSFNTIVSYLISIGET